MRNLCHSRNHEMSKLHNFGMLPNGEPHKTTKWSSQYLTNLCALVPPPSWTNTHLSCHVISMHDNLWANITRTTHKCVDRTLFMDKMRITPWQLVTPFLSSLSHQAAENHKLIGVMISSCGPFFSFPTPFAFRSVQNQEPISRHLVCFDHGAWSQGREVQQWKRRLLSPTCKTWSPGESWGLGLALWYG